MKEKRPRGNDFGMAIAVAVLVVAVGAAWFLARGKTSSAAGTAVTTAPATAPEATAPPAGAASPPVALPPPQSARGSAATPAIPAAAPASAPEPSPADLASVARIPPPELAQKMAAGAVTVIDVRDADSYIGGHIAGAMHIPLQYLPGEVPYLPKDKPIVTYCT